MNIELFEKLKNSPDMQELYETLSRLPDVDFDKEVDFVFGWLKARLVEDILTKMHEEGMSNKELAKRLRKSESYVNSLLDEKLNVTLCDIAELAVALNAKPTVRILNLELVNKE